MDQDICFLIFIYYLPSTPALVTLRGCSSVGTACGKIKGEEKRTGTLSYVFLLKGRFESLTAGG